MALIALGVSGGIGAYKAVEVARGLQKRGHDVAAIMTRSARRFVGPLTFEAITRRRVITGQWAPGANADIEHISLATDIALLLVAPATANIIGKFANGIADDFLTTLYLATRAPVLIAPAMNTVMLEHDAVRRNVATLEARGVRFVEPGAGFLACGWIGKGRLAEPDEIVAAAASIVDGSVAQDFSGASTVAQDVSGASSVAQGFSPAFPSPGALAEWRGRRVLVTAGPTYEDLDPVRYFGNRSSGRMGFALASAARSRGAIVTLVAGPTDLAVPAGVDLVRVRSAADMHREVMARASDMDVVIMAAAVADYTPDQRSVEKIAKTPGPLTLTLQRTPDILADLGQLRAQLRVPRPVLVGFAAETSDVVAHARAKLAAKQVDLIVANDVSRADAGFEVETNAVTIVTPAGEESMESQPKPAIALRILDRVTALLASAAAKSIS